MTILNITYLGQSADYQLTLDTTATLADIQRIAVEIVRSGNVPSMHVPDLAPTAFDNYVVDYVRGPDGEQRVYLRPKVPFGGSRSW